jgi:hypothetical protein
MWRADEGALTSSTPSLLWQSKVLYVVIMAIITVVFLASLGTLGLNVHDAEMFRDHARISQDFSFSFPMKESRLLDAPSPSWQSGWYLPRAVRRSLLSPRCRFSACDCFCAIGLCLMATRRKSHRQRSHGTAVFAQRVPLSGRTPHIRPRLSSCPHLVYIGWPVFSICQSPQISDILERLRILFGLRSLDTYGRHFDDTSLCLRLVARW